MTCCCVTRDDIEPGMLAKGAESRLVIGNGRLESRGKATEVCALALQRDIGFPSLSLPVEGHSGVARRVVVPERIVAFARRSFPAAANSPACCSRGLHQHVLQCQQR